MASWKKDNSGNWTKSESSKKNYTIIDGKKVEQTTVANTPSATKSDTWNKDKVTLAEAKQQTSEADAYMKSKTVVVEEPTPATPVPEETPKYTKIENPTYTPSPVNPNRASEPQTIRKLTPEQNSKLNIAALETKNTHSGNGNEGSVSLTSSKTVKKREQIDNANNNYHTGALEPVVQKYEGGAYAVSDSAYKVSKAITNSDKVASVSEGLVSGVVNIPNSAARLVAGLVNNPVQTIGDIPSSVVDSFKENPYKAAGEIVSGIAVGAVAGKVVSTKLGTPARTVRAIDPQYTVLKGYETVKTDGVIKNRILTEDISVTDPRFDFNAESPTKISKSMGETTKEIPAKFTYTKIVDGVGTMETGETVIKLTKPTKLSVNKTLFNDELVLGKGFEKHTSYKPPTYKRVVDEIPHANGEDMVTIVTEERSSNTIITSSPSNEFTMDATIPKTEGTPYRTLYEYDAVIKDSKATALNGEDIVTRRNVDYFKHSDEMIPHDNIETVKGRFISREELIEKPTQGRHGNTADVTGMDSTAWKMEPINDYESFRWTMDDPVGENVINSRIGRKGKLPDSLNIANEDTFTQGKYVKMDGVTQFGRQLEGTVKVSGKSRTPIEPDTFNTHKIRETQPSDAIPQFRKTIKYRELPSKKSMDGSIPKTTIDAEVAVKSNAVPMNHISENRIIGYKTGVKSFVKPAKPAIVEGFAAGIGIGIVAVTRPQSINQVQYPLPRLDLGESIAPQQNQSRIPNVAQKLNQQQYTRQGIGQMQRQGQMQVQEQIPRQMQDTMPKQTTKTPNRFRGYENGTIFGTIPPITNKKKSSKKGKKSLFKYKYDRLYNQYGDISKWEWF